MELVQAPALAVLEILQKLVAAEDVTDVLLLAAPTAPAIVDILAIGAVLESVMVVVTLLVPEAVKELVKTDALPLAVAVLDVLDVEEVVVLASVRAAVILIVKDALVAVTVAVLILV